MQHSGKLVILAILGVAVASAVASWWFRYAATHRAAEYWGPRRARLIRDASVIELRQLSPPVPASQLAGDASAVDLFFREGDACDISKTPGILHLRHALLEDRSYAWPAKAASNETTWKWGLIFRSAEDERAVLLFSSDWRVTTHGDDPATVLSCRPIAAGLDELLGKLAKDDATR